MKKHRVAIIGSGPTALYLLRHISENLSFFKSQIASISIFEKSKRAGMGMPYNPEMTDRYNLANISSEEIPMLKTSYADWLSRQSPETLKNLNITELPIDKSKVYSRISLGHYFHNQYQLYIEDLQKGGIEVMEHLKTKVVDIIPGDDTTITLVDSCSKTYLFSKIIVATGHIWPQDDRPKYGYYSSPWPIQKLFPKKNEIYNFTIGTLGASLSAFDLVTSMAHRHGTFIESPRGLQFRLNENAPNFRIVMHSAEGWLPHLQYEQHKPIREIYRHTTREEMLSLIDDQGFLSFDLFFDVVCRPALIKAFKKDKDDTLVNCLQDSHYGIKDFVKNMESKHEYVNSFDGMRTELQRAKIASKQNEPVHWMETLDDLMYCLNFHAELLSAEDHLLLRKSIMPFLMNVIAALPLSSATILLALYDAKCIELKKGNVEVLEPQHLKGKTKIMVTDTSKKEYLDYKLFVNCSGQGHLDFNDYPFGSVKDAGLIRKARAKFRQPPNPSEMSSNLEQLTVIDGDVLYYTGGIDIDAGYQVIKEDGDPDARLHDISFIHTAGCRPYSYGLQACNATSLILMEEWKKNSAKNETNRSSIEATTKTYKNHKEL